MSVEGEAFHPPAIRLEAVAAGEAPGPVAAHLEICTACADYVARLKREADAFRARADAGAFAQAILRRADSVATAKPKGKATVAWVVGPVLAAVAAVVLWLRGPTPHASLAPSVTATSGPPVDVARFKGGLAVAVIRDRGGKQERVTGPVEVEAGDRIRVEIDVDRERPVTAGLLSDDGSWALLQSPVALGAGTHYSDLSARFDEAPTDAVLLVGSPEAVDRARQVRDYDGVVAWRVRSALPRP